MNTDEIKNALEAACAANDKWKPGDDTPIEISNLRANAPVFVRKLLTAVAARDALLRQYIDNHHAIRGGQGRMGQCECGCCREARKMLEGK